MWLLSPQFSFCYKNQGLTTPLCVCFWPQNWFAVLPDSLLLHQSKCQNIAPTTNDQMVTFCSPDQFWGYVDGGHRDSLNPSFNLSQVSLVQKHIWDSWQYYSIARQVWKWWPCSRFKQCDPSWNTAEEHARCVWWNENIFTEQETALLSRRKFMLGQDGLSKLSLCQKYCTLL